jgi:hypothetical protein
MDKKHLVSVERLKTFCDIFNKLHKDIKAGGMSNPSGDHVEYMRKLVSDMMQFLDELMEKRPAISINEVDQPAPYITDEERTDLTMQTLGHMTREDRALLWISLEEWYKEYPEEKEALDMSRNV